MHKNPFLPSFLQHQISQLHAMVVHGCTIWLILFHRKHKNLLKEIDTQKKKLQLQIKKMAKKNR